MQMEYLIEQYIDIWWTTAQQKWNAWHSRLECMLTIQWVIYHKQEGSLDVIVIEFCIDILLEDIQEQLWEWQQQTVLFSQQVSRLQIQQANCLLQGMGQCDFQTLPFSLYDIPMQLYRKRERVWLKVDDVWQATTWVYWYFCGWMTTAQGWMMTTGNRIVFSTSVTSAHTTSDFPAYMAMWGSISDKTLYWYYVWGRYQSPSNNSAIRITFSTWVSAQNTASKKSVASIRFSALSDWSIYWYAPWWQGNTATTDRITFSTSVTAVSTVSNLSVAKRHTACLSDNAVYWYDIAWYTNTYIATTDRILFSTSVTSANTTSNSPWARASMMWVSDQAVYWYVSWWDSSGGFSKATYRYTFSTWVWSANTVSNLTWTRRDSATASDWNIYWYRTWWASSYRVSVATTERIAFSTGVTATNTASNISVASISLMWLSDWAV